MDVWFILFMTAVLLCTAFAICQAHRHQLVPVKKEIKNNSQLSDQYDAIRSVMAKKE